MTDDLRESLAALQSDNAPPSPRRPARMAAESSGARRDGKGRSG